MTRPEPRRHGPAGALWRYGLPVLGVVVAVVAWQWATWLFPIRPRYLPSPWEVGLALADNAPQLLEAAWVTILETLAGFTIGAVVGLAAAAFLATSSRVQRARRPLVVGLNAIPAVAVAPLLAAWLGLTYTPHVTLAALISFFPVLIAALVGLTSTPTELDELAWSLTATRWQGFIKIQVPWAMPRVFVGLKLGVALAVIGTAVAQFARPHGGLGTVILRSEESADTTLVYAAIALLMAISIALFFTVVAAERRLLPWAQAITVPRI